MNFHVMTTRPGTSVGVYPVSATGIGTAASAAVISSVASIAESWRRKNLGMAAGLTHPNAPQRLSVLQREKKQNDREHFMSKLKLRQSVTKT